VTYITREAGRWHNVQAPIEQLIKPIRRIIDLLQILDWLYSRPKDQRREENGDGEVWVVLFDEFPDRFFSLGFRDAVGDVGVIGGNSV
jgi:hypothetical protein